MAKVPPGGHGANGRPSSWLAVLIITIGFTVGGLGLCVHTTWWMFWAGVAVTAVGSAMAFAVNIMADYTTEDH
jgi:hypothetical protein